MYWRGGSRIPKTLPFVSRPWRRRSRLLPRRSLTATKGYSSPARRLLHAWSTPKWRSAWMDAGERWTTCSSNACGGLSNTRTSTSTTMPQCLSWKPGWSGIFTSTTTSACIRGWDIVPRPVCILRALRGIKATYSECFDQHRGNSIELASGSQVALSQQGSKQVIFFTSFWAIFGLDFGVHFTTRYGIGLDARLSNRLYGGVEVSRRDLNEVPSFNIGTRVFDKEEYREDLYRAYLYWAPHVEWAVTSEYRFDKFEIEE